MPKEQFRKPKLWTSWKTYT